MKKLDTVNKRILKILQEDGAVTNSDLARQIGLAPASTLERVRKLEKSGVIRKYVALVDQDKLGIEITAFVEVSLTDHSATAIKSFSKAVSGLQEVLECYHLAGDKDFLLKVVTRDIKSYEIFAMEKLAILPHLGRISSHIVLSSIKDHTVIPLG